MVQKSISKKFLFFIVLGRREPLPLPKCHRSFSVFTEVTSYLQISFAITSLPLGVTTKKQSSSGALRAQILNSGVGLVRIQTQSHVIIISIQATLLINGLFLLQNYCQFSVFIIHCNLCIGLPMNYLLHTNQYMYVGVRKQDRIKILCGPNHKKLETHLASDEYFPKN